MSSSFLQFVRIGILFAFRCCIRLDFDRKVYFRESIIFVMILWGYRMALTLCILALSKCIGCNVSVL